MQYIKVKYFSIDRSVLFYRLFFPKMTIQHKNNYVFNSDQ